MGEYVINGGNVLKGELSITGAKNAILPILASSVLNGGVSVFHNSPMISDSTITSAILRSIGCGVQWEGHTMIVDSSTANCWEVPEELVREMRSSIIFMGSILGRFKKVKISYPGGCVLGSRPIDLHLKGLRQLGATIREEHGFIYCEANKLIGAHVHLDFPSVGATENVMLAAVFAEGQTIIENAAREPEIVDLQNVLVGMGADIIGAGTGRILIQGVEKLHDVEYRIMPDRIVAGTYLIAAAITGGSVQLRDVNPYQMSPILEKLREVGCRIDEYPNVISLTAPEALLPTTIRTLPHPGFPTDMQSQFLSLLTLAKGTSIIIETVFESRYKHIGELIRLGADISVAERTSVIKGVKRLCGTTVTSSDLRGGAALILAGLAAEGTTVVENSKHVERGYENIEEALAKLGAKIRFDKDRDPCAKEKKSEK